jgi:hypothetical protein
MSVLFNGPCQNFDVRHDVASLCLSGAKTADQVAMVPLPRYRPIRASATTPLIKHHRTCRPRVATALPTAAYPYTATATAMIHWRATCEPSNGAAISQEPNADPVDAEFAQDRP